MPVFRRSTFSRPWFFLRCEENLKIRLAAGQRCPYNVADVCDGRVGRFQKTFMRILRSLLLSVWCAVALLGHSGIHALGEFSGVCCSVEHPAHQDCSSDEHRHEHAHRSPACHHHGHSHNNATDPADEPDQPSHDSENCRLCDWFLKIGNSFHWVARIVSTEQIAVYSDRSMAREFGDALPLPLTRGPPAAA